MIKLLFSTESHYPADKKKIQTALEKALKGKVKRDVEISVSIVGNRLIRKLNKEYRKIDAATDVLSFSLNESKDINTEFITPPDKLLRLGDIIISYPEAVMHAREENMLVDDAVNMLALHGLNHLLGIHHPE